MAPRLQVHLPEKLVGPLVRLQFSSPLIRRHGTQGVSATPPVRLIYMLVVLWSQLPGRAPQTFSGVSWDALHFQITGGQQH